MLQNIFSGFLENLKTSAAGEKTNVYEYRYSRTKIAFEFDEEEMNKEYEKRMRKSEEIEQAWEETGERLREMLIRLEQEKQEWKSREREKKEYVEEEEQISDKFDEIRRMDALHSTQKEEKKVIKCVQARAPEANKSNCIRVKDINNGDLIEFSKMVEAARFLGTYVSYMRKGIGYDLAMVYRVGGKEFVFEYDGKERPLLDGCKLHEEGTKISAVPVKGTRKEYTSYFALARHLGLLVGEVIEDSKRARARIFVMNGEEFTLEFGGERREITPSWKIVCRWRGIYDGNFEGISGIIVTKGNPQPRD